MSKFIRVMWHEYTRHVFRKRFLVALISMPLLIIVMMGISILSQIFSTDSTPVGYVDLSGFLANPRPLPPSTSVFNQAVKMIPFSSEEDARTALATGKIQAFFLLEPDFQESARVKLIYNKSYNTGIQSQFNKFLRTNLIANQPETIIHRLDKGSTLIAISADGTRQMGENEWFNILIPLASGILFIFVILTSGGYLMQAVVEEKENRTMEIIVTSISPNQLMNGKIVGDIAIGLTQMLFWLVFISVGLFISRNYFDWASQIQIPPDFVMVLLVTMLPSFVMIAALMAAVGATVTESKEAQQISGMFTLPIMLPYYLIFTFFNNPNGPIAVGLSLFPLTAPVALPLRMGFSQVPIWQIATSTIILIISAAGALWLAARTFRLGMLNYGRRLSLRQIFYRAGVK
jgi:ABC-2 type transport system permease protein